MSPTKRSENGALFGADISMSEGDESLREEEEGGKEGEDEGIADIGLNDEQTGIPTDEEEGGSFLFDVEKGGRGNIYGSGI